MPSGNWPTKVPDLNIDLILIHYIEKLYNTVPRCNLSFDSIKNVQSRLIVSRLISAILDFHNIFLNECSFSDDNEGLYTLCDISPRTKGRQDQDCAQHTG